ncbi:hypothetical protein [Microbacterium excoecariae]|uniref:hypothetical protein n=1 Tax=Microbacterium excoecariae TaxID=2715210 RepID=UPI00140AB6D1|nr:hypothetical protein [Microbacterium excoecariae]NHI17427.1 hypothetical protein [Microbacterium excoecariae]
MTDPTGGDFLDELERRFAEERAAERRANHEEGERTRRAARTLRDRLVGLAGGGRVVLELVGEAAVPARVVAVGADWIAAEGDDRAGLVAPIDAVLGWRGAEPTRAAGPEDPLRRRAGFGYVLRALTRRRQAIRVHRRDGRVAFGTPRQVGADHLDLALHDLAGTPRESEVTGVATIAFAAISSVRIPRAADVREL